MLVLSARVKYVSSAAAYGSEQTYRFDVGFDLRGSQGDLRT